MSRDYFPGMGQAVADRTINRKGETWDDVAYRVALGNSSLDPRSIEEADGELTDLYHHLSQASTLMSGRHLQHGDADQPTRPAEVYTNCSTAIFRFLTFKLLLSGSGVGGCYDDDLSIVDWDKMPVVECVIDSRHPDVLNGRAKGYRTLDAARRAWRGRRVEVFVVPDTREGWAKAIELIERLTYAGEKDLIVLLDFSKVREFGQPIKGMQNRPASGPGPLMGAVSNLATLKGSGFAPWKAAMYADHYLAECVLVGGARRSARIAIKYWRDPTIFEFIDIKRPDAFIGKTREEVEALRAAGGSYFSKLWSSNNSVAVDAKFWADVEAARLTGIDNHAMRVWRAVIDAQYGDGTGEPGFLNVDKLTVNNQGLDQYLYWPFAESDLYKPDRESLNMMAIITHRVLNHPYQYIVNPCGEIALFILGGFCVIADTVPYHAVDDDDAEDAFRTNARALMRVNLMNSIYHREVARTNRIGVGITGLHEYMWDRFGLGFRDAIAEGDYELEPGLMAPAPEAMPFWRMLKRFSDAVEDEITRYADELGVQKPHTWITMKPAGTTSKLFGLTEAAHLPSMRKLLRWVQFRHDDPLVEDYRRRGYPVRELKTYSGTTIVGFPTAPVITTIGMDDKLVTAGEATPEEQFRWLRLLEHYWLQKKGANQISYTLKYRPSEISFDRFEQIMFDNVKRVRAVSVLPQVKMLSYEYQPEEPISDEYFDELVARIDAAEHEDVDRVHVECEGGACPIDFSEK